MDKLIKHFDTYFRQTDCTVLHPMAMEPHIDALLYQPTEAYPYWKLVTMGASDYKMAAPKNSLGNRNEYVMFIDPDENMMDPAIANWYYNKLMQVAWYPMTHRSFITYGHSIEWQSVDGEEMISAYLEMPQVIEDVGVLRCKFGLLKTAVCLQVVLLNREETNKLLQIGSEQFSNFLYPEEGTPHFLCERNRSSRF
jgi:hypothetical protein